jgi:hypothetical protein
MKTLGIFLFFTSLAHGYSIENSQIDWISGSEALANCKAAGHSKQCDRALKPQDKVDSNALESCLTFKSEEDRSPAESEDIPQFERQGPGFGRYGQCLKAVKNKVFHPKAISVCGVMNDFLQHLECLQHTADQAFHGPSLEACLKLSYQSTIQGLDCTKSVKGRILSSDQVKKCESMPFRDRANCFRSSEQLETASCERRLFTLEEKLEALAANRSSSKDLKKTIAPLLEAIRESTSPNKGAQ